MIAKQLLPGTFLVTPHHEDHGSFDGQEASFVFGAFTICSDGEPMFVNFEEVRPYDGSPASTTFKIGDITFVDLRKNAPDIKVLMLIVRVTTRLSRGDEVIGISPCGESFDWPLPKDVYSIPEMTVPRTNEKGESEV